jgi:RNA polymerase sigma factor (sigma-70 family)
MDLESALASLDDEDRAVVWLHDVEGYGHKEIGELFGRTESFSKTRLSRARARLRALLESPGGSLGAMDATVSGTGEL